MKKLFAIILVCLMVLALGACGSDKGDTTTTQASGSSEIKWETLADDAIVGAWEPEESVAGEYVLFTPESKLRLVYGTVVFESDIQYGTDGNGNKSAYTDGNYLYGQWTYTINDDALTIVYPSTNDAGETVFETKVFKSIDYSPITLLAKENFVPDETIVGTWTNATYGDSYTFSEDGFAVFTQEFEDGVNSYTTEIKHAYTIEDGKISFHYFKENGGEEVTDTFDLTIEGTKLLITDENGDSDYYLNGEGDPALAETTPVTE